MAELTDEVRALYPTEGPLWAFMEYASALTDTPPIMHLASLLPVFGFEACRRGLTIPEFGPPRAWIGLVAPSGVSKTSTVNRVRDLMGEVYNAHVAGLQSPWQSLNGSLPGVLHALSERERFHNRTCAILTHPEFTAVLRRDDAADALNEIYDGKDVERHTRYLQKAADKGEGQEAIVKAPTMQALVTTTPTAFRRVLRPETVEGGLFYRFMWVHETLRFDDLQPRPTENPAVRQWVLDWFTHWFRTMEGHRARGLAAAVRFELDAAMYLEQTLFERVKPMMVSKTYQAGIARRLIPHAWHIATIYAVSRAHVTTSGSVGQVTVTLDDTQRAAAFALRILDFTMEVGDRVTVPMMELDAKQTRLMEAITAAGTEGLPRKAAFRLLNNNVTAKELDTILEPLEAVGDIMPVHVPPVGRGRPGIAYFTWDNGLAFLEALKANSTPTLQ